MSGMKRDSIEVAIVNNQCHGPMGTLNFVAELTVYSMTEFIKYIGIESRGSS